MTQKSIELRYLLECPNDEFLIAAYRSLLGRMPDDVGVRHYAKRLASGTPREVVLAEIRSSAPGQEYALLAPSAQLDKITARYLRVRNLPMGNRRWNLLPRHPYKIPASAGFDWQAWAEAYLVGEFSAASSRELTGKVRAVSKQPLSDLPRIGFWEFLGLPDERFLHYAALLLLGHELDEEEQLAALSRLLEGTRRLQLLREWRASAAAQEYRQTSAYAERLLWQRHLERDLAHELEVYLDERPPVVELSDGSIDYAAWVQRFETLSAAERKALATRIQHWEFCPTFSILLPILASSEELAATLQSIQQQIYPNWEIIIAGEKSALGDLPTFDTSISVVTLEQQSVEGEPAIALNAALAAAKGTHVICLHPGDRLNETALFWFAEAIQENPDVALLYSDEDRIDATGQRVSPFCKPDYNVELHLCQDYLGRAAVYRTETLRSMDGFSPDVGLAVYWDAELRFKESGGSTRHVSRFLVHVRSDLDRILGISPAEAEVGRRVVQAHLDRLGIAAEVLEAPELPQCNRIKYALPDPAPSVCIIIPTRDKANLLRACVDSILEKTDYPNYEIILVDNGSKQSDALAVLNELCDQPKIRSFRMNNSFNWSALNNEAARMTSACLLCFLNNDVEIINKNWLGELVAHASRDNIGVVGARLWYPEKSLQHAGIVTGINGVCDHSFRHKKRGYVGHFGRAVLQHAVSAVTGACMVVKKSIFENLGGFDEDLKVTLNDVMFCLRCASIGYYNLWTPYAELMHHESKTRKAFLGFENEIKSYELSQYFTVYGKTIYSDPFYNPNLSLRKSDFSLSITPRKTRFSEPTAGSLQALLQPKLKC